MYRIFRALLISAVTTGVVAGVVYALRRPPADTPPPTPEVPPRDDTVQVDADRMTEEERDMLLQELEGQV